MEGFCRSYIIVSAPNAKIDAFLVGTDNASPICIRTKSHHMTLTNVFWPFVMHGVLQTSIAFHAFFDFVAGAGRALILVITRVSDLRILAALEGLQNLVCFVVCGAILRASTVIVCLCSNWKSIRQLNIRIRLK